MSAQSASLFPARFMASKRYRWTATTAVFALFAFVFLFQHRDSLLQQTPSLHSSGPAGAEADVKPDVAVDAKPDVDWSRFAYTQYVTDSDYLCNSVMFFEALHRVGSRADRVIMHPSYMLESGDTSSSNARLLIKARNEYNVNLVPISVQHRDHADATWADSFTKLLAFNQTQYSRVLSIDSDSILLQHMDELFLLPPVPVAMPRAYWLYPEQEILSSQVVLIEPSEIEFSRVMEKINSASKDDYDMEIVNYLYRDSALVLPHRWYDMLTGEFRNKNHTWYLGSDVEPWDPAAAYSEAKLIHFSDWPLPKPWLPISDEQREEVQPECTKSEDGGEDCTGRIIWNSFYDNFKKKRKEICN